MRFDDIGSRSQHQVKGITQNNFSTGIAYGFRRHGFDRAVGADRHECGCFDIATLKGQAAATGFTIGIQKFKLHRLSGAQLKQDAYLTPLPSGNQHRVTIAEEAVLLLHGMSDSPYSLRALGETLNQRGYRVVGLRLPGHGTAPSGLKRVTWQDMAAAVRLSIEHLASKLGSNPIHIIGYSTGAPLALDFTLNALEEEGAPVPASLVLISPAVRVHPTGALAGFKNAMSALPGLGGLSYLSVMDEFDPYKYNSFATNAGAQVHQITRNVDRRIQGLSRNPGALDKLPPILVLKSTVDSTVTTDAVVTNLLMRLPADRNELVLFDINRNAVIKSTLLVSDPGPLTHRMMADQDLPFAVTFVTNENPHSTRVVARHKAPFSLEKSDIENLSLNWPRGVVSLSHVALPFPPDDPLYGQYPSTDGELLFLGDMAIKGERGLLRIPADWLLRLRYNPFYPYLERRLLEWVDITGGQVEGPH